MGTKKILCFLDSDKGRDVEILLPLMYYAQNYLNCTIEYAFAYDVHAIYRKKPSLVILPNTIGSNLYYQIAKYAYDNKIKVFALISEGNFRTNGTFDYWGYNKDKNYFQEYICHWSKRTYDFLRKEEPSLANKMVVTGGTGFDRYKIYKFQSKADFFKEHNLPNFTKVIGYAGWAFGKLFNKQGRMEFAQNGYPEEMFKWLEEQMYTVEDILKQAIKNNPDTLFVLKRHPNEANPSITRHDLNEMVRLQKYNNVIYLSKNENIHDLISVCDLWTGFETTTCLESWLMGNGNTVLINPDPDFKRDEVHKGSIIVNDYLSFQSMIDDFYTKGSLTSHINKTILDKRQELIADTIGYGDGLNHLRAGYYLSKVFDSIPAEQKVKVKLNFNHLKKYVFLHIGAGVYNKKLFLKLPKFKKVVWIMESYKLKGIPNLLKKYSKYLSEFYTKNDIDNKIKDNSIWNEII